MQDIDKAVSVLTKGGVVIFPTETLYGLGTIALDPIACAKVFVIKNRAKNKPVPVIIGEIDQLDMLVGDLNVSIDIIKQKFWPGPLSVLLPAKDSLPSEIVNRDGYVCVRYTSHPIAKELCIRSSSPLIATSANISGEKPPASFDEIDKKLLSKVDFFLSYAPYPMEAKPSTIIKFLGHNRVKIIREGAVTKEKLMNVGFKIEN
jgi:L-threonylcarbamoyladenylate synthase